MLVVVETSVMVEGVFVTKDVVDPEIIVSTTVEKVMESSPLLIAARATVATRSKKA